MKIFSFILILVVSANLSANPILYAGENFSGQATTLQNTGGLDSELIVYFSPFETYIVFVNDFNRRWITGENGLIENGSLEVPQCWNVYLRAVLLDQLPLATPPRNHRDFYWLENLFPGGPRRFIVGFGPGRYNNFDNNSQIENQIIGYTATRDLTCRVAAVSRPRYEFSACNGNFRNGFISWQGDADRFIVQQKVSSRWNTIYSGSDEYTTFNNSPGAYNLRIKATNGSGESFWKYFAASVPSCGSSGGGGGTQPY